MNCKNCNHPVTLNFCPSCGQSVTEKPLDIEYYKDALNKKFNPLITNKSVIGFVKTPIQSIKNFIACKRINIMDPINLLILTIGLYLLAHNYIFIEIPKVESIPLDDYEKALNNVLKWYEDNMVIASIVMILPISVLTWLFFKKKSLNLSEHIALNMYIACFANLFSIAGLIIVFIEKKLSIGSILSSIWIPINILISALLFTLVINSKFSLFTFIKYLLAFLIYITCFITLVTTLIITEVVR